MNIKLVTGNTLETSVEASDDRALHAGIVGTGDYVFKVGQRFAHQIIGSDTIRIFDGEGVMQGAHFIIPYGKYDDIEIDSCVEGYKRIDLICARYHKYQNAETVELVVVKGREAVETLEVPKVTVGSILEDTPEHNMPLKKVTIQGSAIIKIENAFEEISDISVISDNCRTMAGNISNMSADFTATANNSFLIRGQLTSSNDLNDITLKPGAYWSTAAEPPANLPEKYAGNACAIIVLQLETSANQRRIIEIVTRSSGSNSTLFYRVYHITNGWGDWVELARADDVNKALGNDEEGTWKNLTLVNGFTAGSTGNVPQYRKIGNHVSIRGTVGGNVPNTSIQVATIPAGYRPKAVEYGTAFCSGSYLGRIVVNSSGVLNLEWLYRVSDGSRLNGEMAWIQIKIDYYVD